MSDNFLIQNIYWGLVMILISPISAQIFPFSDQCSSSAICSQIYSESSCSCLKGFQLATDGKSCHLLHNNWTLLHTYTTLSDGKQDVRIGTINNNLNESTPTNLRSISGVLPTSLAFDARNDHVYFLRKQNSTNVIYRSSIIAHESGINYERIAGNPGTLPISLAFDWITGNLYYLDFSQNAITVCGNVSKRISCEIILENANITDVFTSFSLDANLGLMFWLGVDSHRITTIFRAEMDGTFLFDLVNATSSRLISRISSLALDVGNFRIYWSYPRASLIESSDYNGACKKLIRTAPDQPIFLDILGDEVYWSTRSFDAAKVESADKFAGKNRTALLRTNYNFPQILMYHIANQPILRENSCNRNNTRKCSNLCVLVPPSRHSGYRCLCGTDFSSGSTINCNASICLNKIDAPQLDTRQDKIIITHENILTIGDTKWLREASFAVNFHRIQLDDVGTVLAATYTYLDNMLVLADSGRIFGYNLDSRQLKSLGHHGSSTVVSIGIDIDTENIYWTDDSGSVSVMSAKTGKVLVLMKDLDDLCSMLIVPDQRSLFLAVKHASAGVVIWNYHLDGSAIKSSYHDTRPEGCVTLSLDDEFGLIIWSEVGKSSRRIEAIHLFPNGEMKQARSIVELDNKKPYFISNVVIYNNTAVWLDTMRSEINVVGVGPSRIPLKTFQFIPENEFCGRKLMPKGNLVISKKARGSPAGTLVNHLCHEMGCSHLCLPTGDGLSVACRCSTGFLLEENGKSCLQVPDTKLEDPPPLINITIILTACFTVLMCSVLGIIIICVLLRRRNKEAILSSREIHEFLEGGGDGTTDYENVAYDKPAWEKAKDTFNIESERVLGSGEFGIVYKGSVTVQEESIYYFLAENSLSIPEKLLEVAVKTCKSASVTTLKGLLSEIKVMSHLGKHENIVSLVGAYTKELQKGLVYVFVEYCELGSLLKHLRGGYLETGNCEPTATELLRWSREIANAMEFLAMKKVVHADLATRNVLLTAYKTAKVSDFGLSRKMYNYTQYVKTQQEPLPWRWMAPESLQRLEFDEKTDVWAFGVTLWEIFSFGNEPYPGMSWSAEFAIWLQGGLRLPNPHGCHERLYSIMLTCWDANPSLRPNFALIKEELKTL